MIEKISKLRKFIGPEGWKMFLISPLVGILLFAIEYSFIFVIQGFLFSLGILSRGNTYIPSWYPNSVPFSLAMLFGFGVCRAIAFILKTHFSTLLQLSFTFLHRKNVLTYGLKNPHLISNKDIVSIFSELIAQSGSVIANSSLLMTTAIASLFFLGAGLKIAPIEMLIGISALALCLLPLKYTSRKITGYGAGLVQEWSNSSDSLLRGLKNNFFLTVYNQVDNEIKAGSDSLEKSRVHLSNYSLISGYLSASPMFLGLAILCVISFLSMKYIHTEPIKLISFFYIFIRLAQAASEASSALTRLQLSFPGMKILYYWNLKFDEAKNKVALKKKVIEEPRIVIEADHVSFGYNQNNLLFKNLNFKIQPSEVLVIKGESGTGKSTLLSLILGLFHPVNGDIKVNSTSTRDFDLDLQQVLAYVGPEPYIIQGTVRENLLYGLENKGTITEEELWNALERMELKELVSKLPLKLSEPIHDIPQFSTGQKQRLSFARALVRKPSLLILDEATANLDSATEKKIIDNLQSLFKNCTSIIVTHKNSFDNLATHTLDLSHYNG